MWHCIEQAISAETGQQFNIVEKQTISNGGLSNCNFDDNDKPLNLSFKISNNEQSYFVKLNSKECLINFQAEAYSLKQLAKLTQIPCPKITTIGTSLDKSFLVLEYIPFSKANPKLWFEFGQQLAKMHNNTSHGQFGWQHDNYIGNTIQPNHWKRNWTTFFSEQRIAWQLQLLSEKSILLGDIDHIAQVCHDQLLHHKTRPCLVHGDLWQGNVGFTHEHAMIFDPACYYGDREVDIAMTELFGQFPDDFYRGYQAEYPLDKGYERRRLIYNFYHVLNHANIFGGIYIEQAKAMLTRIMALAHHE
ncbi:fructosamine kinase family protein [Litorilituus sediminis]|uniref:Fructosamine kinase family protein n=1 Tax=Litorilituus sediminis TaxID=718192 RepID=A0A4P6P071_9GAMM|nr:fructosamine kinase family protein [Litorilituus sediminis]QBG34386.1 fructosamine kinase family protein [Litorilituus sediminis]